MKQKSSRKLGAVLNTYQGTAAWTSVVSIVIMIGLGWDAYKTVILVYLPWFNLFWAYGISVVFFVLANVVQYLVLQPSIQAYVNRLEYQHKSPQRIDHELILANQVKIMDKLGIKDE